MAHDIDVKKYPVVITTDALWLLVASAMALRSVPGLSLIEDYRLAEAIANATRSLNDAGRVRIPKRELI